MAGLLLSKHIGECFADTNLLATSLLALVIDQYGTEALEWDFDTLRMELADDFNVDLPQDNADKLQAIMTALTTDTYYRDYLVFHHVCTSLDGDGADFQSSELTTPHAMGWAVFEVAVNDGKEHPAFTDEVKRYMGACLAAYGVHVSPKILAMADFPPGVDLSSATSLSDDPVLFNGFNDKNRSDADDVDKYVQERFELLLEQLQTLPIQNRDAESFNKMLDKLSRR
jgi:hypothetical protein